MKLLREQQRAVNKRKAEEAKLLREETRQAKQAARVVDNQQKVRKATQKRTDADRIAQLTLLEVAALRERLNLQAQI
jgi:hypothetical protein